MSNYTSWWQPPNPKIDEHWLKSVDARRGLNFMKTAAAENWWKFDENWEFDENVFLEFDEHYWKFLSHQNLMKTAHPKIHENLNKKAIWWQPPGPKCMKMDQNISSRKPQNPATLKP